MVWVASDFGEISAPLELHRKLDGSVPPPLGGVMPVHFWLLPPLQVQISTAVPLAVAAPVTSRHSPDSTPTTVPSGLSRHCWLVAPVQVQIWTRVPLVVAWLGTPLQSQICSSVPSFWLALDTSRHRPEPTPRSAPLLSARAGPTIPTVAATTTAAASNAVLLARIRTSSSVRPR